jgi:hypothetical protein
VTSNFATHLVLEALERSSELISERRAAALLRRPLPLTKRLGGQCMSPPFPLLALAVRRLASDWSVSAKFELRGPGSFARLEAAARNGR